MIENVEEFKAKKIILILNNEDTAKLIYLLKCLDPKEYLHNVGYDLANKVNVFGYYSACINPTTKRIVLNEEMPF